MTNDLDSFCRLVCKRPTYVDGPYYRLSNGYMVTPDHLIISSNRFFNVPEECANFEFPCVNELGEPATSKFRDLAKLLETTF